MPTTTFYKRYLDCNILYLYLKGLVAEHQDLEKLFASCNDFMKIFFDGALVYKDENYGTASNEWRSPMELDIPSKTQIIGISCQNNGNGPNKGLIASTSRGKVSDKSWDCTSQKNSDWASLSTQVNFDTPTNAPMSYRLSGRST